MIVQAPEMREVKKKTVQMDRCTYRPHKLFDFLILELGFETDLIIAKRLKTVPSSISRIRHGKFKVGPTMILAVYDETDLTIEEIRELLK